MTVTPQDITTIAEEIGAAPSPPIPTGQARIPNGGVWRAWKKILNRLVGFDRDLQNQIDNFDGEISVQQGLGPVISSISQLRFDGAGAAVSVADLGGGIAEILTTVTLPNPSDLLQSVTAATTAALAGAVYTPGAAVDGSGDTFSFTTAMVDGVTLAVTDRLLVKDEASAANGIWVVQTIGATIDCVRAADYRGEVTPQKLVGVIAGTTNGDSYFTQSSPDTNPVQIGGPGGVSTVWTLYPVPGGGGGLTGFFFVGTEPGDSASVAAAITAGTGLLAAGETIYIVLRPGTWSLTGIQPVTHNIVFLPWQNPGAGMANGTVLDISSVSFAAPASPRWFTVQGLDVVADQPLGAPSWTGEWNVQFLDCRFVSNGGAPNHQIDLDSTGGLPSLLLKSCEFLAIEAGLPDTFNIRCTGGGPIPVSIIDSKIDLNNLKSATLTYLVNTDGGSPVSFCGSALRDFDSEGLVDWSAAGGNLDMTKTTLLSDTLPFPPLGFTICGGVGAGDRYWNGCTITTQALGAVPLTVGPKGSLDFGAPTIICTQALPVASPATDAPPTGSQIIDSGTFNAARPYQMFTYDGNTFGYYPAINGNGRSWTGVTVVAGNNNDLGSSTALYADFNVSSAVVATITGIEARPTGAEPAYDGQEIRVRNGTGNALTFTDQDVLSADRNRFNLAGGTFSLAAGEVATFKYFGNSALATGRWERISAY